MAAPKGNQFWKIRSKHGREKLFTTPALLWEAACEYFEWCDNNPWVKAELIKTGDSAGDLYEVPIGRPYTLAGLCLYLGVNTQYFGRFKKGLELTPNEDFSLVISSIEEAIYTNKVEGAMVGVFNATIVSRELGLAEKVETENKNTNVNYNSVPVSKEEIKEISKELDNEY